MRNRFLYFVVALAVVLALSPGLFAQAGAPAGGAVAARDLQGGVWLFGGGADTFNLPRNAPFQPSAKAKFDSERNQHGPHVVIDF